jgi:lactoylglutathione lyase
VERPGGADGPQTSWLTYPDGYRIELVQWPPGHADGITAADFGWYSRSGSVSLRV